MQRRSSQFHTRRLQAVKIRQTQIRSGNAWESTASSGLPCCTNIDMPQTKWYTSLVNVLLEKKCEVLFKFFQMPSLSRIDPCNIDTLFLGTATINHSYVLMYHHHHRLYNPGWALASSWGFVTVFFLWGGVVSLTPNPQPGEPGYPFLSGSSPLTCLAWEALPVAYATTSIALGIIWPHKPHYYAKIGIPSGIT